MRQDWRYIPQDGVCYLNSEVFLTWPDEKVLEFIKQFEAVRYHIRGWRNWNNLWRSTLGLDTTHGKRILDYGSGYGIEALQFCRSGNRVTLSDIFPSNVAAAERMLKLSGYEPARDKIFDIFYSNGVLHHTPEIRGILEKHVKALAPDGEVRLLLYTDLAWTAVTGQPVPPADSDVRESKYFETFVAGMDASGDYADWYNREKLANTVSGILELEQFNYITQDGRYATAILRPCA
jgi:SAM-dependent methyltransferase